MRDLGKSIRLFINFCFGVDERRLVCVCLSLSFSARARSCVCVRACVRACVCACVLACVREFMRACVFVKHGYCLIGDNGRQQYLRFCLFEMYVNEGFVIRCLYSAVSLTLVREQRPIRIIYCY